MVSNVVEWKCARFLYPNHFKYGVPICREIRLHKLHHRAGEAPLWTVTYSSVNGVKPLQFTNKQSTVYKHVQTSCGQAGSSSTSSSSSSLSSLTIPSSILSSLSLCPSRYLGLGAALVVKSPPGRARSSPNRVSLASLSIAFAKQEAKVSRDLCTSAWTCTEDVLIFSAEEKKSRYYMICEVHQTNVTVNKSYCMFSVVFCFVGCWPQSRAVKNSLKHQSCDHNVGSKHFQ